MPEFLNREVRKWIYSICLAIVPLLVLYGAIDEKAAPLWVALIGAVVAPTLALTHLTPKQDAPDGDIPDDLDQSVDLEVEQ